MTYKYILLAASLGFSATLAAQDLQKEITIDRTIQPALREAYRLNGVAPAIVSNTSTKTSPLNAAEYTSPGRITNSPAHLPPAAWRDSIPHSPYRGYASVGYFPWANLGANAGYRFFDSQKGNAGVWMQYDRTAYHGDIPGYDNAPFGQNYISLGANGVYQIGSANALQMSVKYTHAGVKTPFGAIEAGHIVKNKYTQGANDFDACLGMRGAYNQLSYSAGMKFEYFGFGNDQPVTVNPQKFQPAKQKILMLDGSLGMSDGQTDVPWLGVEADWSFLNSRNLPMKNTENLYSTQNKTITLGHIRPHMVFGNDETLVGRIGFNMSIATGNDRGALNLAPELELEWAPLTFLGLYASWTGGKKLNRMSTLFDINPYMSPICAYERSNVSYDLEAGINVGPVSGLTLQFFGGTASVHNLLTPTVFDYNTTIVPTFSARSAKSWHAGARVGYTYRSLLSVDAKVETGRSNKDCASWHTWHDAAKVVAGASVTVAPTEPLSITAAYELRTKRRALYSMPTMEGVYDLGNISNLQIGGTYRITPQITGFINFENLLNHRSRLISSIPAQGLTGLFGVAYKF